MKRIKILTGLMVTLLAFGGMTAAVQAQSIVPGSYQINDGTLSGVLTITPGGVGGKYIFEGGTKHTSGAECMMSGPATLIGSELEIGYKCAVRLTATPQQLTVDDYKKCIPCDPGAYVTGTYIRK